MGKITLTYLEEKQRESDRLALALAAAKADPERALANLKRRTREHAKRMLDPNYGHERHYPTFIPGVTTTAEYIRTYQALQPIYLTKATFVHADRVAPEETWGVLHLRDVE